jgi:hypothetical protein
LFYSVDEETISNQHEDGDGDGNYADYARININLSKQNNTIIKYENK